MGFLTFLSLIAAATALGGVYLGYLSSELGLEIVAGGVALASFFFLISFLLMAAGKKTSWFSLLFGLPAIAGLGYAGFLFYKDPLSDISSDLVSAPKFVAPVYPFNVEKGREYLDPSLQIPRPYDEGIAPTQLRVAPDLATVKAKASGPDAYAAAMKVIRTQLPSWEILLDDPKKMHAEMTFTTPPLSLRSDVALEVRYDTRMPNDSEIAVRCRARIFYADLGNCLATVNDLNVRLHLAMKALEEDLAHKAAMTPPPDLAPKATGTSTSTSTTTATATVPSTAAPVHAKTPAPPKAEPKPVPNKAAPRKTAPKKSAPNAAIKALTNPSIKDIDE